MTTQRNGVTIRFLSLLALGGVLLIGEPASAQLKSASSAVMGTGENYTALARGFGAIGINPAGLAMPGGPAFSMTLPSARAQLGLSPIGFSDFKEYEGALIPASVKEEWLQLIAEEGTQTGGSGADITPLALSMGSIGIQLSTMVFLQAELSEDAAELILFGNAGRTGSPIDLELAGSAVDGFAVSTVGVSFALPLDVRPMGYADEAFAIGATVKYSVGNFLALGRDAGTVAQSDPVSIDIRFPSVVSAIEDDYEWNGGSGIGLDLGAMWEGGSWQFGVAVQNVLNTFEWDVETLRYRPMEAVLDEDNTNTDALEEEFPYSEAPTDLKTEVEDMTFDPSVSIGLAYRAGRAMTLTADIRRQLGEGIFVGPETHAGVGVVLFPTGVIRLRGGGAWITDGYRLGGGAGLALGPLNLSGAAMYERGEIGDAMSVMLTFSLGAQ